MSVLFRILQSVAAQALSQVWLYLGTTAPGYWFVSLCCALIGWFRNKHPFSLKALRDAFLSGLAGTVLVFSVTFCWKFAVAAREFWDPVMSTTAPPSPSAKTSPASVATFNYEELKRKLLSDVQTRSGQERPPGIPKSEESDIVLSAVVVDPSSPGIRIENKSRRLAQDITWELVLYRESDQALFSYATQNYGYVKARSTGSVNSMSLEQILKLSNSDGQLKVGDSLTGCLAIDCPECVGVTYVIDLDWLKGGWFFEIDNSRGHLFIPKDRSKEGIANFISVLKRWAIEKKATPISGQQQ